MTHKLNNIFSQAVIGYTAMLPGDLLMQRGLSEASIHKIQEHALKIGLTPYEAFTDIIASKLRTFLKERGENSKVEKGYCIDVPSMQITALLNFDCSNATALELGQLIEHLFTMSGLEWSDEAKRDGLHWVLEPVMG